jgi:hypothetical protein
VLMLVIVLSPRIKPGRSIGFAISPRARIIPRDG